MVPVPRGLFCCVEALNDMSMALSLKAFKRSFLLFSIIACECMIDGGDLLPLRCCLELNKDVPMLLSLSLPMVRLNLSFVYVILKKCVKWPKGRNIVSSKEKQENELYEI